MLARARVCVYTCASATSRMSQVLMSTLPATHPPPLRASSIIRTYTHTDTQINRPCCAHQVAEVSRAANIIHNSHRLASRCSLADQVVVLFPFLHRPLGVAHLPAHNMCNICVSTSTAPAHMQQMCLSSRRTVTSLRIAQRMRSASSSRLNDSSCRHVCR